MIVRDCVWFLITFGRDHKEPDKFIPGFLYEG